MAQVYGQIQPLKKIRKRLDLNGIDRFNSIEEIQIFMKNVSKEKASILNDCKKEYENDIFDLEERIRRNETSSLKRKREKTMQLDGKISRIKTSLGENRGKSPTFFLKIFYIFLLSIILAWRLHYLQNNYVRIVHRSAKKQRKEISRFTKLLEYSLSNREAFISAKASVGINRLIHIEEVIESLRLEIVGAIGEQKVVKEIKKLSDEYILINDFSLKFNPPIYNRKEKDKILSIQIDHLLITKAGIFILETKNWSKQSIESSLLWSPIDQIKRASYALFILLKRNKIRLKWHQWGEKKIPIRSIVVMINHKPKEEFQFVKVKTLRELNGYIQYFKPIFSDSEVVKISNYFLGLFKK